VELHGQPRAPLDQESRTAAGDDRQLIGEQLASIDRA
jgi:hypothetical protein